MIGFTGYTWRSIRRRCAMCSRKILDGVVNVNQVADEYDPNFKVVCWECFHNLPKSRAEAAERGIELPEEKQ